MKELHTVIFFFELLVLSAGELSWRANICIDLNVFYNFEIALNCLNMYGMEYLHHILTLGLLYIVNK